MLKTFKHLALAGSLLAATTIATTQDAEAHRRHGGHAAGAIAGAIIGLGVLGAYAAGRDRGYERSCYPGRRVCDVVGQRCWTNRWGEYVCKDDVRCYRREVCD
ncbi:MAG: hypothetical protein IT537_21675 [Hyphomicrobiales bacterium]|jgi:hypothetical protein|nr:hypothetical protein [Hyphomicrobiales bacterium]